MNILEAKQHPEKLFKHPDTIYNNSELTREDKISILTSWKNQIELRTLATQEGMVGEDDNTEIMRLINELITLLTDASCSIEKQTKDNKSCKH